MASVAHPRDKNQVYDAIITTEQPIPAIVVESEPPPPSLHRLLPPPPPLPTPRTQFERQVVLVNSCVISKTHRLVVGSLGPGYCVTGHDPLTNWSFCAVLTCAMPGAAIAACFSKLNRIPLSAGERGLLGRMKIQILGGWKDNEKSRKLGGEILHTMWASKINQEQIDCSHFCKKKAGNIGVGSIEYQSVSDGLRASLFFGGVLHPSDGEFLFFTEPSKTIDELNLTHQRNISAAFLEKMMGLKLDEKKEIGVDAKKMETSIASASPPFQVTLLT